MEESNQVNVWKFVSIEFGQSDSKIEDIIIVLQPAHPIILTKKTPTYIKHD